VPDADPNANANANANANTHADADAIGYAGPDVESDAHAECLVEQWPGRRRSGPPRHGLCS
jgi:hypothetical protein